MRYFKINDDTQINLKKVTQIGIVHSRVDNKYLLAINGLNTIEIGSSSIEECNRVFASIENVINQFQLGFVKTRDMLINLENVMMIKKYGDEGILVYVQGMDTTIKLWYDSTEERNNEFERIENRINYFQ
jgi:hypothetical protein